MSGVAGASGLIGTAVGLAVTLGALGLAFNLVDRSVARTQEQVGRKGKGRRRQAPMDDIFDLGFTQKPRRKGKKFQSDFGGDFNIFAV
jgi:hypothetical protein